MIKRDRCRDTPRCCQGVTARLSDWDPACGLHQGQRSNEPRTKAGHMTAPRNDHQRSNQPLLKRSRTHMIPPVGEQAIFEAEVSHWSRSRAKPSI